MGKPEQRMIFKVKILLSIVSLLLCVVPSAATDFTYQEYTKAPEIWKRGFVFGISQYISALAQPDEEAPYPVRTAFQRCLASSTDTLLVRQVEAYQFAEKGFRGVLMGNIDSRPVCATHERFATIRLWIRILRIARPISSFSANC